jgi:TonB family protein
MEAFAFYLLKSVIWLTGFALIFILFLRNERFFFLNRIYLITGILTAFFFPLISIHYTVVLPAVTNFQTGAAVLSQFQKPGDSIIPDLKLGLLVLYVTGTIFVLAIVLRQALSVFRAIKRSEVLALHPVKLIKTTDYTSAFSFFSYVFVNPSITDVETKEIMNHELVHISQKHWFDLLLVELLCLIQWFNPFVWMYVRFIRQNHEYLADEVALQRTSDPAVYKAALLNQIVGAPVVSLSNSFSYSLNKKRFNMMKNIISSPYRKMKILLILPVFAIVLYSFAKPDYKYINVNENPAGNPSASTQAQKEVKGTVVKGEGIPLEGANITVRGTTIGTVSDSKGQFKLGNLSESSELVISYVGFRSKVLKPVFTSEMTIKMVRDTIPVSHSGNGAMMPPPPPPPPPAMNGIDPVVDGPPPVYVVDGVIATQADVKKIDREQIWRIDVLKDKGNDSRLTDKYGDQGKNGVVEITTKKKMTESGDMTPPPPPPPLKIVSADGKTPMYIIDGVVYNDDLSKIAPESIESIVVLKDESATAKYGEKGKNGVLLIKTKQKAADTDGKTTPAPSVDFKTKEDGGKQPLVVVDGIIKDIDINSIDPATIESMNVLGKYKADNKYGDKAKDGVVEITLKKPGEKTQDAKGLKITRDQKIDENPFVVVEEMPSYNGGVQAMQAWISENLKYPEKAKKEKITGSVPVNFIVTSSGKVRDVKVIQPVNPLLDAEAVRVVSSMPDWKPGYQNGKAVDVYMKVDIDFSLK